jgi:hypothetical protein
MHPCPECEPETVNPVLEWSKIERVLDRSASVTDGYIFLYIILGMADEIVLQVQVFICEIASNLWGSAEHNPDNNAQCIRRGTKSYTAKFN